MFEFLFPDKRTYLHALNELAASCTTATGLLERGFADPRLFAELTRAIKAIDAEAGATTDRLHTRIERAFTLSLGRADIHHLAARLKRVIDFASGTAGRGGTLPLRAAKEPASRLASVLAASAREVQAAVAALNERAQVFQHCRAIKGYEETGDAIWAEGLTALFAGAPDPVEVLVWKEMYDLLEESLDACDDVANVLETISFQSV